jgi:replicative DNA helicase
MSREIPHNFEVEQALLGTIMHSNAAYSRISEITRAEHFADPLHAKIFETMRTLIDRGQVAEVRTLRTYLEHDQAMQAGGGVGYLARLFGASAPAADAPTFAQQLQDLYLRRQLIEISEDAAAAAYARDIAEDARQQIEMLERRLFGLAEDGQSEGGFKSFAKSLTEAARLAELAHRRGDSLAGVGTGFRTLDQLLGGLHRSDLIILAGRPAMGKTALATNIAFNAARAYRTEPAEGGGEEVIEGASVGFFSLEMSDDQLTNRILAEQTGVPSQNIRSGKLTPEQMDRYLLVAGRLQGMRLFIDDTPALSMSALRSRARRLKRTHGLGLIVVDYLQLIEASNRRRSDNRVQEVSEISRGLKTLAKELDVPVLALSQLSRQVESRADKRPVLSDLRESGTIEQDADVVLFVYREEYYRKLANQDASDVAGKAEVIVAKQRHGATGRAMLTFDGAYTKFSDPPVSGVDA